VKREKEQQAFEVCCMSVVGHSRPMHSVPVPINVRCYSNSDIIVRRSEVTLRADSVAKVPKTWTVIFSAETYTSESRH